MSGGQKKIRRSKAMFWGGIAMALMITACGQGTPPDTRAADEAAVRNLDAQWSKTAAALDVDGTTGYYSDDASMLPPNAPLATGKQAIRAVWATYLVAGYSVSWQVSNVEAARSSDLAYAMGAYQSSMKDSRGNPVEDRGKYVEVWKKQADGKWKVVADIFNSDLPAAPAVPEAKKTHAKTKGRRARTARRSKHPRANA